MFWVFNVSYSINASSPLSAGGMVWCGAMVLCQKKKIILLLSGDNPVNVYKKFATYSSFTVSPNVISEISFCFSLHGQLYMYYVLLATICYIIKMY